MVARPAYDRDSLTSGIVHLGVGAFMRAHLAVYCDDILASGDSDWAIAGYSLRRPNVFEQLEPQDCLYTVGVFSAQEKRYRLIGSISSIAVAPEDPQALIGRIAAEATRIVTITVTEKGYCIDAQGGGLNFAHPDIQHDLDNPASPRSLVGYLVAGLKERRADCARALTILSCDNLPDNGRFTRNAVRDFAARLDPALLDWIDNNVSFPSSMVDRIVPATTDADLAAAEDAIGLCDLGFVATEAFSQWVIEDHFAAGRPDWAAVGALLVDDVAPYEAAKLRLLNGAHSTIAYCGYLAGYEYVHEVMQDDDIAQFVRHLMQNEISPATPEPPGMEHDNYIEALLERFRNPSLRHRTWQIAMDGSQKLPQRLLATISDQLDADGPLAALALAAAAWIRYTLAYDETGGPIDVSDPLAEQFKTIALGCGKNPQKIVAAFLAIREIFGDRLPAEPRFVRALERSLELLLAKGTLASVRIFNEGLMGT